MQVYLAHNYSARAFLLDSVVPTLEKAKIKITSTWLNGSHSKMDFGSQENYAIEDCYDIARADALIYFLEKFNGRNGTGKHFELGYAYGIGKSIFIIGREQDAYTIFHFLPNTRYFETIEDFIAGVNK